MITQCCSHKKRNCSSTTPLITTSTAQLGTIVFFVCFFADSIMSDHDVEDNGGLCREEHNKEA